MRHEVDAQQLALDISLHDGLVMTGVIVLTVSGGDRSQNMWLFALNPPLRG